MKDYQKNFIEFALSHGVLKFGEFKLKSGRLSPYFFNAGMFTDGNAYFQLASFYADAIVENFDNSYDVLFGPAYKGISLATSASIGLKIKYNKNIPVSFNRKEVKDHGEGGNIIGSSLKGNRVLLVDDVITAGTTIRESVELISNEKGKLEGVVIALDRQEQGLNSELSAIQEVEKNYDLRVSSIISLNDLIEYLETNTFQEAGKYRENILAYKNVYGI